MERIIVRASGPLQGTVAIGGAKNSVLKLMAATTLAEGEFVLHNVPRITDVECMAELLESMGMQVWWGAAADGSATDGSATDGSVADGRVADGRLADGRVADGRVADGRVADGPAADGQAATSQSSSLHILRPAEIVPEAPYELVEKFRASIVVLGPLLARCGRARVAVPGGDDFGSRPIDMHHRALEQLGATFEFAHGYIEARADGLIGTNILLEFPSVGATENALMAAVLAKGTTVIDNAAREPEISDLAGFLNRMGATVLGAGSSTITIEGVDALSPVEHTVIPDRIEAATFMAACGIAGGEITLVGARSDHMDMFVQKVGEMGMRISPTTDGLWAMASRRLSSVDIATLPYPGLATDYKPLLVAMLATADGVGIVTENIFHGRFRYVDELKRMGADVRTEGHHAVVRGRAVLSGAPVRSPDIRAGAALVVAALKAEGETVVLDADHIDRGYERFVEKLRGIGADVTRA